MALFETWRLHDKKYDDSGDAEHDYDGDRQSREIAQGRSDELLEVDERESALEKEHRERVEDEEQQDQDHEEIIHEFHYRFLDQRIDGDQSEDDETDHEIADKIADVIHECRRGAGFLEKLSIGSQKQQLFDQQKNKSKRGFVSTGKRINTIRRFT